MGSRTIMKQQIMRQMVMDKEKPLKSSSNHTNANFSHFYRGSHSNITQNHDNLSSFTSNIADSDKNYDYCNSIFNNSNTIHFNPDSVNNIGEDFPILSIDYSDPISNIDSSSYLLRNVNNIGEDFPILSIDYSDPISNIDSSSYLLRNTYPIDNFNIQPFNMDYNPQSLNIENNIDSNSYNSQYHNLSSTSSHMGPIHDTYGYETSFSCPVTGVPVTSTYNEHLISNSNSAIIGGGIPVNYEDIKSQLKDRSKKESHNRIERKRRDFINQQIVELGSLLPSQMMTEGESKKNKGNILKNSVLYIQHLQKETNNTANYKKELNLAFMMVENYRKQVQELQQQNSFPGSENKSSSPENKFITDNFNQYLLLHEQNRNINHTDSQLFHSFNNNCFVSSCNKSPLSQLENEPPFKVEPSSAHSSFGNKLLSPTYQTDDEIGILFNNPQLINQHNNTNYPSALNDSFFNSNNNQKRLARHKYETMECK